MNGPANGVLAVMALEKIGKDVIDLIADIERDLEAEQSDIEKIQQALSTKMMRTESGREKIQIVADKQMTRVVHAKIDARDDIKISRGPWPHLVLDNLLDEDVLSTVDLEIARESYKYDFEPRGAGRIEYCLLRSATLWRSIYSASMMRLIELAFNKRVSLSKDNLLQLRRMNDNTPEFPLHNDYVDNRDHIVSFLYLSHGWTPGCGGRLRLHKGADVGHSAEIAPLRNRLVAFHAEPTHWHSVEKVRRWERISALAVWDIRTS